MLSLTTYGEVPDGEAPSVNLVMTFFFGPHPLAYRGSHRSRESLYSPNRCRDATALELTYLTAKARKSRGGGGVSSADIGQ